MFDREFSTPVDMTPAVRAVQSYGSHCMAQASEQFASGSRCASLYDVAMNIKILYCTA